MSPNILFGQTKKEPPPPPLELETKGNLPASEVLSEPVQKLLLEYQHNLKTAEKPESAFIHADEIASKMARFYERIRKIVDWKEENLLRRNAIERILKRALIAELSNLSVLVKLKADKIAGPLVLELIRGGHLPNGEVQETKIDEVAEILEKYLYLLKNAPYEQAGFFTLKNKVNFYNWILEIAACEIEEALAPPEKENALIKTMTLLMFERIKVTATKNLSEEEKLIQTYIAVHRTLFDLDDAIITYHFFQYKYPQWNQASKDFWQKLTSGIFSLQQEVNQALNHPLSREFFNICERTDTPFTILGDILDYYRPQPEQLPQVLANKENLKKLVSHFYDQRMATLKSRLFKIAIFSTLSVFVSNWFTFFVVEVPVAHLFYEGFSLLAAVVDFIVPSLAMFVLVAIIKPPSPSNRKKVIETTSSFVYQNEHHELFEIKPSKKRNLLTELIIGVLYGLGCIFTFGTVAWAFYIATIPITSVIMDTIGIALNVFAALVVRNKAKEITVEEKSGFGEFIIDILSLPVAEIGSFLANKWKEYNIASVFLNVFVEIPFVAFIEFVENWRGFLKERKASIH